MMLLKCILRDLTGLLFPNLCCGCGTYLYQGETLICTRCIHQLPYTDYHLHAENRAAKQLWGRLPCHAVMALLYFKKRGRVKNLIHHLKYKGRDDLGIKLGRMIGEKLKTSPNFKGIDLIVPVPLHPRRERLRGYNQSRCLAEGIASVLQIPVNSSCLLRKKATSTQTKKGRYQRFENMQTVFFVSGQEQLQGKHVLLVDDVLTTGATLEACGTALLALDIEKLSIATVAFTE